VLGRSKVLTVLTIFEGKYLTSIQYCSTVHDSLSVVLNNGAQEGYCRWLNTEQKYSHTVWAFRSGPLGQLHGPWSETRPGTVLYKTMIPYYSVILYDLIKLQIFT